MGKRKPLPLVLVHDLYYWFLVEEVAFWVRNNKVCGMDKCCDSPFQTGGWLAKNIIHYLVDNE